MATPHLELKKHAKKYLDLHALFPHTKLDLRLPLSDYQRKKINQELSILKKKDNGTLNNFVPMGRGRKKYLRDNNLPPSWKGVFLSGGAKVNTELKYIGGEVQYKRGGAPRARSNDLDTSSDDIALIASAKKILKRRAGRLAGVTAAGKKISSIMSGTNETLLIKEAVRVFNKYADMSDRGEQRIRRLSSGIEYFQDAAHPAEWGMAILFEGKKRAKK